MKRVDLTDWEHGLVTRKIAADALTYMTHHAQGHLRPHEVETMNKLRALSDKLRDAEEIPDA